MLELPIFWYNILLTIALKSIIRLCFHSILFPIKLFNGREMDCWELSFHNCTLNLSKEAQDCGAREKNVSKQQMRKHRRKEAEKAKSS